MLQCKILISFYKIVSFQYYNKDYTNLFVNFRAYLTKNYALVYEYI